MKQMRQLPVLEKPRMCKKCNHGKLCGSVLSSIYTFIIIKALNIDLAKNYNYVIIISDKE